MDIRIRNVVYIFIGLSFLLFSSCRPPIKYTGIKNDPIKNKIESNQFSIFTYNIKALFGKNKKNLKVLTDYLNDQKYDFILIQELFDEDARQFILEETNLNIYQKTISRVDYESFPELLFQDSGLFVKSKFPQIDLSSVDFGSEVYKTNGSIHFPLHKEMSVSIDFLANKSILGSLFQINDSTKLFLFTTHVQALGSGAHKRKQLGQVKNFIGRAVTSILREKLIEDPKNLIVLLTGDFNSDAYNNERMELLNRFLGNPRDLHKEFNKEKKEYTMFFNMMNFKARFDYIFAYDSLGSIPFKKIEVNSINATDIKNGSEESLSDHHALKAVIEFD